VKNAYKNLSIFKCVHEAHSGFENQMSVHHILNKKGCFPHGCFHFKLECKLFKQGKPCYRGYKKMGRNCNGCRHFYDEKIYNRSELQISEEEYKEFQRELDEFEDWLEDHKNREHEINGKVDGVKPLFRKRTYHNGESFSFNGFLLVFRNIFIGLTHMEDFVYARVSAKTYASLKLGRGDVVDAKATLTLDNGRLVMKRLRRIDVEDRGEPPIWNESSALVARESATLMPHQPEGCVKCPFGALVDVEDFKHDETKNYRQLYCLQGVKDYRICPVYHTYSELKEEKRGKSARVASCMTTRVNIQI